MEENIYKAPEANIEVNTEEYQYAGFWIRVLASIIDTILIMAIIAPLLTAIYGKGYWMGEQSAGGIWNLLFNYLLPAVAVVAFWVYKSATPGKMITKISVIDANTGGKLSWGKAVGRYLCYYISMLPLMLGFIWVAFDGRKQAFHDKIAGTFVVKNK